MKRASLGIILPVVALGIVLGTTAFAQNAGNALQVKVQPALFEQVVNPGDTISTSITVTNPQATVARFSVGVQDISDVVGNGQPVFTTSSPQYGVSGWVNIPNTEIAVPAHGSVVVPFTINVPRNAGPGGHYGAIFISYGASRPALTGTGVGYEVGSLIELRIAGDAKEAADVTEFSTDKSVYQTAGVTFTATVANQGNVLLQPRGPIDVTNMFGQKVGTVVINNEGASVFPGTSRSFTAGWSMSGFAIGRYDAVMSLSYGDTGSKTISKTVSFWVIPFMPILAVLAAILFFVALFVWSVKAYIRKRVNEMSRGSGRAPSVSDDEKFLMDSRLPFSRLLFIVVATIIFAVVFLIALFFFFG